MFLIECFSAAVQFADRCRGLGSSNCTDDVAPAEHEEQVDAMRHLHDG